MPHKPISLVDAVIWADTARAGDYLIRYVDPRFEGVRNLTAGFNDSELAQLSWVLMANGLSLEIDDVGLVARALPS